MIQQLEFQGDRLNLARLDTIRRRFTASMPVDLLGYFPEKTYAKDETIPARFISFSFVLEGTGVFELDGVRSDVVAPFIFVEIPGRHYKYAPRSHWRQIYFDYRGVPGSVLDRWRILPSALTLCWPILMPARVVEHLEIMLQLASGNDLEKDIDRLDALAELAILESLPVSMESNLSEHDLRILDAERYIRTNYRDPISLQDISNIFGFSRAGFHRYWKKRFDNTPSDLISDLRLKTALFNLTHSAMSVKEVAAGAGFADQNYFARLFRKTYGVPPTEFRAQQHGE